MNLQIAVSSVQVSGLELQSKNHARNLRHAHERNDEVLERITSAAASKTTPNGWKNCLSCMPK